MLKANLQHKCSAVIFVQASISQVLPCAPTDFSHAPVTYVTAHSSPFWKPDEVQGDTKYRLTPVPEGQAASGDDCCLCVLSSSRELAGAGEEFPTDRKEAWML
jgi:hypothetical protein